jgi:hypothetical protein
MQIAPLWRSQVSEMELLCRDRGLRREASDCVYEALCLGKHPADIYHKARAILSSPLLSSRKSLVARAAMQILEDMEDAGELERILGTDCALHIPRQFLVQVNSC